MPGMFDAG